MNLLHNIGHGKSARALFPNTCLNIMDISIHNEIKLLTTVARELTITLLT